MQPPWQPSEAQAPGPDSTEVSSLGAFKTVFADPEWKTNMLLALVFMIIPIVGPIALSGWMAEVHQRHLRKHPKPVPKIDFSDFGDYIRRGLPVFLGGLVIGVPLWILGYLFIAAAAVGAGITANVTGEPLAGLGVGLAAGLVALLVLFAFPS